MNAFPISPMVVERLGWVLVHSLWQFAAVALVGFLLDRVLRRRSSSIRYVTLLCGLTLVVAAPVVTWAVIPDPLDTPAMIDQRLSSDAPGGLEVLPALAPPVGSSAPERTTAAFEMTTVVAADTAAEPESFVDRLAGLVAPWLGVIVGVWCCGVVLFSVRPVSSWFNVQRLKTVGVTPVTDSVQQALKRIEQKLQIRHRVQLLQSTLVPAPVVVGCFQSVILLPASFISGVPVSQLEAILAHELAHVRRYDYLVNLLQTLVETLFFYHPAVWWMSHRIRIERENCCDDLVVAVLGNKVEYGRALLAVEEFRGAAASTLALSAKGGSLLARVKRLFVDPAQDDRSSAGLPVLGILLAMITAVGVWSTVIAIANATAKEDASDGEDAFGPESHGLQFRLVALSPDVNDNAPDLKSARNDWTRSADMTFGVELKNVSKETLTLAGVRYGDNFAKESQGTLRTEMIAPHWFEFDFTDMDGKPIPRTHREYYHQWSVLDSASTHELASGQSLIEVLRPANFNAPMDFDLPPGKYQVQVRYHGPDDEFRENVRKHWPDKAILNAWKHDVVSNSVEFEVTEPSRHTKPEDLIWGQPVNGLQAALEYRLADDVTGNPLEAPGIPVGTSISVVFHLKNVSEKSISFISETGRQGDYVHVVDERGEKVDVPGVFYTGWPIDVAWKLEPGEIAQLSLLTPGLGSLDQPGKYTVRYTVRFNSRQQKDEVGNVIFPRPGDYDKEVDTGDTPLFLQAVKRDVAANGEIHGRLFGDEMIVLDRKPGRTKTTDSDSDDNRPGDDGGAASGQQELSNAWREFYTAQSDNGTFFIRNAYIDLIGRAATDDDVKQFINDSERDRREKLIDRLLASDSFWPFQESLIEENRRNKSGQNLAAFPARILRGPQARLRADLAQTLFGEQKNGLQVGIRLRSNGLVQFKNGERVPLEILIRNAGTETITRDFSFDFIANVPDVFDEQGNRIPIEAFRLLGAVPLHKETLRPGDVFIYPHHGLGIGPKPNPGKNWNPHTPVLSPGKYRLSQVLSYGTSGFIEFEVLEPDKTPEAENDEDQTTRPQAVLKPAAPEIKLPDFLNVMAVGFADDSRTLWSVSTKDDVRFRSWDVATKQKSHEVKLDSDKHGNFFHSSELKLSPDRKRVVGSFEGKVCVWDSTTGKLVNVLTLPPEQQNGMLTGLSFSADFSRIACGLTAGFGGRRSADSHVVVWDVASGEVVHTMELAGAVQTHCTALSANGRWLAAGGQQAGLRIWDVATGRLVHSIANSNPELQHPDPEVKAEAARKSNNAEFLKNQPTQPQRQ